MDHFTVVRAFRKQSTCAKTQTAAAIFRGRELLSAGYNLCAPEGIKYGECVPQCPRSLIQTGANYELCAPVHAEVFAALSIRPEERSQAELRRFAGHLQPTEEEILAAFTTEERQKLWGATLYLVGHYYACDNCIRFLHVLGISDIQFDRETGNETLNRYKGVGIIRHQDGF